VAALRSAAVSGFELARAALDKAVQTMQAHDGARQAYDGLLTRVRQRARGGVL
jgi:hypothetical protein